ncbi:MAG: carboxypeptidase regulatory-like domain-containing protein, partial [Planctomycetota bacterium]
VLDALEGTPIPRFTASVSGRVESDSEEPSRFNPFAQGVEFEGSDGRFELTDVVEGEQSLRVSAPGYVERRVGVTVGSESARALEVRLTPGTIVQGTIVDADGEPIAGALVTTEVQVKTSFERLEAGRQSIETALAVKGRPPQKRTPPVGLLRHLVALGFVTEGVVPSGEDGRFELTGLEPGRTEVLAFHRDYRAGGVVVALPLGENDEPVRITLTSGGGLRGKVLDSVGQPVAAAMVIAVSPGLSGGPTANGEFHQARSRTDGSYEMRNLEGGAYLVVATRGDENLSLMGFFGTLNFDLVTVPPTRTVTKNLVDTSANACRVTGVVTRAGMAVTGGVLLAVNLESEGLLGLDLKAAAIEADGSFAFEGLVEGEYEVTFEGEGPRAQFLLDVPDAPALVHNVALPEGTVRGRVVDGETGRPVAGVRLRLQGDRVDAGGGLSGALSRGIARELFGARGGRGLVRTGSAGRFRFTGLEEGRYALRMESSRATQDYAPFAEVSVEVVAGSRGEVLELGDILLEPAIALRGRVQDAGGTGIAGARVVVTAQAESGDLGAYTASDLAKEDGAFEVRGLGPGKWRLRAVAEGFAVKDDVDVVVEAGAAPPDDVEVTLERGIDVTAVVVDGEGRPRAGVTCVLAKEGDARSSSASVGGVSMLAGFFSGASTTDERGERDLGVHPPGTYVLRASQGFASAERLVELRPGDRGRLRVVLE